jgi:hypothetical protein
MNKRPGHVAVTTDVGFCNFCDRTRNLRREEHHLGALVRTVITCESCHRTLSSTMGVATAEAPMAETPAVALPLEGEERGAVAAAPAAGGPAAEKPARAKRPPAAAAKAKPKAKAPKAARARTTSTR